MILRFSLISPHVMLSKMQTERAALTTLAFFSEDPDSSLSPILPSFFSHFLLAQKGGESGREGGGGGR